MIPEDEHLDSPKDYDVTKPRIVPYKNILESAPERRTVGKIVYVPQEGIGILSDKVQREHP